MDPLICYPSTMDQKPIVVLNCRSLETLLPSLQSSLQSQTQDYELKILESKNCPSRLSQITEENKIYFFFDEDINLPTKDYLKSAVELFQNNPDLLILGGKYLPHKNQNYLAKSYNNLIEFWLMKKNKNTELNPCQNLPGGVWLVSGKVKNYLQNWQEPTHWAGEDTFSIRWLQNKGVQTYHHSAADVFHFPQSQLFYYCRRAFLQGRARSKLNLKSDYKNTNWSLLWKNWAYWPGWALHQAFVELGSLSIKAKRTPTISPVA